MKVCPSNCDVDRRPKMVLQLLWRYLAILRYFSVVLRCRDHVTSRADTFIELELVENVEFVAGVVGNSTRKMSCVLSYSVDVSGVCGHIAIFGCRLLSQSVPGTFFRALRGLKPQIARDMSLEYQ